LASIDYKVCPACGEYQPIRSDRTYCSTACYAKSRSMSNKELTGFEKTVVIGDVHRPYHDEVALGLVMRFIAEEKPDTIFLNGDIADCNTVTWYPRVPGFNELFKNEVEDMVGWLTELRRIAPRARIVYICGNHEHRLFRFLVNDSRPLYGLKGMSIQEQFELDKLGIEWVDCYATKFVDTYIEHGPNLLIGHFAKVNAHAGYTVKNLLDTYGTNLIQGHVHSFGFTHRTQANGKIIGGWESGCLCTLDPEWCRQKRWMHGFIVIHREPRKDFFNVEQVPIIDGKMFYGGKLWQG
jgi:predicted phosphodiesterase